MSSYSDPIRQILVTIDASLTGDLSLKRFANELFLNTSYLSTLFKKEVGMTLTDYVNANRIRIRQKGCCAVPSCRCRMLRQPAASPTSTISHGSSAASRA